jgi:hypothetical protein
VKAAASGLVLRIVAPPASGVGTRARADLPLVKAAALGAIDEGAKQGAIPE